MARKKRIVTTEELDELPDGELEGSGVILENEPSRAEVEEMDAIEYLLSLGGDDGVRFRVDKLPAKPGDREAFCMNYGRDSLTLDAIRDTFGGGTYKITAYGQGSKYAGQRRVTIADLPRSTQAPAAASQSQDLAAILQAAKGDNSSLALVMKMMESQSQMIAALLSRPLPVTPPPPSLMELVAMMREMNRDQPKANEGSAVELLLKGIELGKEFTGGEESMMGLAGKGIEILRPLIERQAQAPAAPAANPRPALPPPQSAPATGPAATPQGDDAMLRQLNWLRQQTVVLCAQAARQKNPELYAELLLDNLPDFINPQDLLARVSDPGAVAQLVQVNADVAKYPAWFEEFRKSLVELLNEYLSPESDPMQEFAPGPGGHDDEA